MISTHSRATNLDDIHIIPRVVGLPCVRKELSEYALLSTSPVSPIGNLSVVVGFFSNPCIDEPMIQTRGASSFRTSDKQMMNRPQVYAMLVECVYVREQVRLCIFEPESFCFPSTGALPSELCCRAFDPARAVTAHPRTLVEFRQYLGNATPRVFSLQKHAPLLIRLQACLRKGSSPKCSACVVHSRSSPVYRYSRRWRLDSGLLFFHHVCGQ